MPRYAARHDTSPPERGGDSRRLALVPAFGRSTATLAALALIALPFAIAQHGSHGGSSHPAPPPQSHQTQPQPARPTFRGPAPSPYHGVPQNRIVPAPVPPGPPSAYRPASPYPGARTPYSPPSLNSRGEHLGGWLQNHQGESFTGQENALRREPGFSRLPQPQQQRLIDRLHQLDTMPPQQRQRTIGRIENMERLSPDRRQAVRNSAQELGGMDPGRKQQVRGAFRVLREMPPSERQRVLNSPAYRSMYSDHERQILGNLLSVEPYNPR